MVRRAFFLMTLIIGLLLSLGAFAAEGPLMANLEAVKVVIQDGGQEVYLPAEHAYPKDIVEYRLTYKNAGDTALRNVSITDPVPQGTEYVTQTATQSSDISLEFSIDGGKNYYPWPILVKKTDENGQEIWVEATPDMVTHLRWVVTEDFEPESEITFTYRAIVK